MQASGMIPEVDIVVGIMGFLFCYSLSNLLNNPLSGDKKLTNLPFSNKIWMHRLVSEHPGFIDEF